MPSITQQVEVEATIDFDVYCATCGAGLCFQSDVDNRGRLHVAACSNCCGTKYNEGFAKGHDQWYLLGYSEGGEQ